MNNQKMAKKPLSQEVFKRPSSIDPLIDALLTVHAVAYDQLLLISMQNPVRSEQDDLPQAPLRFPDGFGLDASRTGLLVTIYGIFGMIIQYFVSPSLTRRRGVLKCLESASLIYPLIYLATPFTVLLTSDALRQCAGLFVIVVKCMRDGFATPCVTILLNRNAPSWWIVDALNGVSVALSAIGRAVWHSPAGHKPGTP